MYQIANGTNSTTQSRIAIQSAVEISIVQLLPGLPTEKLQYALPAARSHA
jgi:hypothetical protein